MRRWFMDSYFDLIVWYDDRGNATGFQLCYDKPGRFRNSPPRVWHDQPVHDMRRGGLVIDSLRGAI